MTDKYNYKSISLRNHTYKKLGLLSNHYIDKYAKTNKGSACNGEKEVQTI